MQEISKASIKAIRKSPFFDAKWYLRTYHDVASAGLDPAEHYLVHGVSEGRNPSEAFNTRTYLQLNPDVAAAGVNPLLHYETNGKREGRFYALDQLKEPEFPAGAVAVDRDFRLAPRKTGRTAIFAAYFPAGKIPETDLYYLKGLREVVDNIVLVADSPVFPDELAKLEGLVTRASCRRHGEYDFGSYKRGYALADKLGLLRPDAADELVIANDSCVGPVYPFAESFEKMAAVACDFWGMTQHKVADKVHLQSFFYVFRSRPLRDGVVGRFFEEYEGFRDRIHVILNGELRLTDYMIENGGYRFMALTPTGVFGDLPMKYPVSTLSSFRVPLLKVKTLKGDSHESIDRALNLVEESNPELAGLLRNYRGTRCSTRHEPMSAWHLVKMFLPYALERWYQCRRYKMDTPQPLDTRGGAWGTLIRLVAGCLPYGVITGIAARQGCAFRASAPGIAERIRRIFTKKNPLVSIVVASYNYERLILETLESLVGQTYRNFEIVVVDDGSTDASLDNISAFIKDHAEVPIRLVTHPGHKNRGLAATVELGIRESRGEYVAFCESDDLWTPDHLEVVVNHINDYGGPGVVVNDVAIFGDVVGVARAEHNRAIRYRLLCHTRNRISPAMFRKMNYILTFSAVAARRDLLLKCDYHPDAHPPALDWWLWRQLCFDQDIHFINRPLTRWRMHESYLEKTRVVKANEKPIAEREKALMAGCDAVIRRQHPYSLTARYFMVSATGKRGAQYVLTGARRKRFFASRANGLKLYRDIIARNSGARILVCLHLFYEDAWPLISEYLHNLDPYQVDLLVTCVEGAISEKTLESVRNFRSKVKILTLPNRGFDIGPFVESLNHVNLDDYDIVFKLQSKGIRRPFIYIYGQVFKWSDWFFNLFDGVLDGMGVHQIVDGLMNGGYRLAAAENLLVQDPKHKQSFVRTICGERNLTYVENYSFVAGTCFAMRAESLKPLKDLGLGLDAFGETVRGVFSLAHFLERWMCFAADGACLPVNTVRNTYPAEVAARSRTSALRLLDDPRFKLDYEFFYRVLELRPIRSYDVVEVRLGDIHRRWYDGRIMTLDQCEPFKYLNGDKRAYDEYCAENKVLSGFDMGEERFENLVKDMEEYDPLSMPVVMGPRNLIFDGQHRSCILLKKYGPDHVIKVLRFE